MTYEEMIFNAKVYAQAQADALTEIYNDVSPEEWEYEYQRALKYFIKKHDKMIQEE